MVKVSVIIPVYNTEEYLEECLESIINQTLKDIEIICINDGSTDNSLKILENYSKKDKRIKVISQENKGVSAARNKGLSLSQGKYIYIIDSDDTIKQNTLSDCFKICEEKNLDFIIFKLINYDDMNEKYYEEASYNMPQIARETKGKLFNYKDIGNLIFNISVSPVNKLYKKSFLDKNKLKFYEGIYFEDNIFFYPLLFSANRIYFYDEHLYIRRRHQDSITGNKGIHYMDIIKVQNLIIDEFIKLNVFDDYKEKLYNNKIRFVYNGFMEIEEKSKELYFNEMKKDFTKITKHAKYKEFLEQLNKRNLKIFNTVIKSNEYKKCISDIDYYDFKSLINKYKTARIDIKNLGNEDNSLDIIKCSDTTADIKYPYWLKNKEGEGASIESEKGEINLKIKCIKDGTLKISIRGIDIRDKNNTRFPIYIDYNSIKINQKEHLKENKLVSHINPYIIKKEVKNGEIIEIYAKWKPFNKQSTYNDKLKKEQQKNKKLEKQIKQLKNTKSWKITKPLRYLTKKVKK